MNEFLPRTEPIAAAASVQIRAISATQAGVSQGGISQAGVSQAESARASAVQTGASRETPVQSAGSAASATANYARIQADVARALQAVKDSQPTATPADLGSAEQAMLDLMPQPVIMLPMPPADPKLVEFVAQVAQSLAQQQVQARAAHARIASDTVDAAIA